MKARHKVYLRLNLMSIFFVVISFISVTLAWFAYSGLVDVKTEIGVKAWYIELEKDGQPVSNDIVISLDQIYPGMNTINETVKIKNLGDSDASLKYAIVSARILDKIEDKYIVNETTTSSYVEDVISHNYPFHININLSKNYVVSKGEDSFFEVSISWPLDSDNNALDSLWGTESYKFQKSEEEKKQLDANYQIKPSIQIVISVSAEQYIEEAKSSDTRFDLGDEVLYDVVNNMVCTTISPTCLKTHIIDVNSTLEDSTITLLPDPNVNYGNGTYDNYNSVLSSITTDWTVTTRSLLVNDLLKIISKDITNSVLVRNSISDSIIGNIKYQNRIDTEINKAISYSGYYRFINEKFSYLQTDTCYWTSSNYNTTDGFAINKMDAINSKIYNESKNTNCNIIPLIIVSKTNL